MCNTDVSDAFKLVPIHPSLWPYQAIKWQGKYYFYTCLVFGSRSSPHKTVGATTCLEYLGIILDSTSLEARFPVNKILVSFLHKKSCTKGY